MTDDRDAPDPPDPTPAAPDPSADPTPPRQPGPVQYRGADLEPDRGPGLGCFRFQLIVLAVFIVLTPLSVRWGWPWQVSAGLLFAVIVLLLVTGQTIIFLLRLVAADRRGRRRPLASDTRTVGELEDDAAARTDAVEDAAVPTDVVARQDAAAPTDVLEDATNDAAKPEGPMRQ